MNKVNLSIFILLLSLSLFSQERRIRQKFSYGDILISVDEKTNNGDNLSLSNSEYQTNLIGVATGNNFPIRELDRIKKEGICQIKVIKNANIKKGDYITSSSLPGLGMKATKTGMIIGVAIEDLNPNEDYITCLINIQYVKIDEK